MPRFIAISLSFEGFHRWKNAPPEHAYLRERHRHLFVCKAYMEVGHGNRAVEFIALKRVVQQWCAARFAEGGLSCEQMAQKISERYGFSRVEVWEDGENGGAYER